jgi:hypothetical protein
MFYLWSDAMAKRDKKNADLVEGLSPRQTGSSSSPASRRASP